MPAEPVIVPIHIEMQGMDLNAPAYNGDAGFDLSSRIELTLKPFERASVPCGISMAIPEGYAGLVVPRSGLAIKHGISVVNGPGLIDSGYRGEICVILINLDPHDEFVVHQGDRIAQLVVVPIANVVLQKAQSLPKSERGERGFGSSGTGSQQMINCEVSS